MIERAKDIVEGMKERVKEWVEQKSVTERTKHRDREKFNTNRLWNIKERRNLSLMTLS